MAGKMNAVDIDSIRAARQRLADTVLRTPLVRLSQGPSSTEIYLKLENLQPIGAFKMRGAGNGILARPRHEIEHGVWTASAGNMAQGVAWHAQRLGIPCTVVVPDNAPDIKLRSIERLGGRIVKAPYDRWFETFDARRHPGVEGVFIHPFDDPLVMAGNGVIGLEILEDLPDVSTVVVPWGGGGLCCGIASAVSALQPDVKVYACEVATTAPLAASLQRGKPAEVPYIPSFVDGIGAPRVFADMFDLARDLIVGSLVASLDEIAAAIRLMVERNHIVAEGAGAASVAAALSGKAGARKIVCIVSGGNIDSRKLAAILTGDLHGQ